MAKTLDNSFFPTVAAIPEAHRPDYIAQSGYLINGEILSWKGQMQEVKSPICIQSDNEIEQAEIGFCPSLDANESVRALDAAEAAYNEGRGFWPSLPTSERIAYTEKFLEKMVEKRTNVVKTLMWEIGKTEKDATTEFDRTVDYVRDTIKELKEMESSLGNNINIKGTIGRTSRTPIGTVLCMGPFNYPLNETFTTMLPAVITGNSVVFKPARYGVLLHSHLLEAYNQFPRGVINTIYGDGRKVIGPLVRSGRLDGLAFIGSTGVAQDIMSQLPKIYRCRPVLGLGAKNAAIVLSDADLDRSASVCAKSAFGYNGQRCTAAKIIFAEREIAERFTEKFCSEVDKLNWGMPWEKGVSITPLPEDGKTKKMEEYVSDAVSKGARVANENGRKTIGTFYSPTVLTGVNSTMRIYNEEQFGPVSPIVVFDDLEETLEYVAKSDLRQQAAVFTENERRAAPLIKSLRNLVCRVTSNSQCQRGPDELPFMGKKDSGVRELSVREALLAFTDPGLVTGDDTPTNRRILDYLASS